MNKLDAVRLLGNAYWHVVNSRYPQEVLNPEADGLTLLMDKFHYLRRSLRLEDLMPQVCNEGYNGRMPTWL